MLLPHLPDPLLHSLHHPLLRVSLPLMTSPSDPLATAASDLVQALATRLPSDLILPTLFTLLLSFTAQAEVVATLEVIVSVVINAKSLKLIKGTARRAMQVIEDQLEGMEGIEMPVIALVMAMKDVCEEEVKEAIEGSNRLQGIMIKYAADAADELKLEQLQTQSQLNTSLFKDISRPQSSHTEAAVYDHNI